jgi:phosphate transport system permease protein
VTTADLDVPRELTQTLTPGDRNFRGLATSIGVSVLVLTGSVGVFLGYQLIPTLQRYGLSFFTETQWLPQQDIVGMAAVLVGTIEVAGIALLVGFPLALSAALYISEYAPVRLKATFVAMVDLMAAVPSIIYGLWGFFLLQAHALRVARWLAQYLGWIPIFHVNTDANSASFAQTKFTASAFIAGLVVSMMVIPLACSVMRGVFASAPLGEREAALALGATKWGMIRTVVIPFGQGGIIGGTMLSLGRALGETVAVLLIISPAYDIKINVLEVGTQTTSALIAGLFGEASAAQLSALLSAGFVLFVMTLVVNTVAAVFVGRSRSGATTEI